MFFGLSMRQFFFAVIGVGMAVTMYFVLRPVLRNGNAFVDVYACRSALYRLRIYYL